MSDDVIIPLVDPLIGQTVGEYQVIEPIGEGGMGVVYLGIHPLIKKRVAIKVLKPQVATDEHQVQRLVAEAEAVNAIRHRGIVDIFSLGALPDGRPYVVMEYLEGEPLDLWLSKQPGARVSLTMALELLLEICAPLAAAHRAGVVHRDLKPSNVFLCSQADGTRFVKLLDFGLAKRIAGLDGNTKQTNNAVVAGTPDYMAPEQARGLPISARTDIYALGVIAYELLTGHVPFTGATPMDVMVAHVGQLPRSPRTLEPSLPDNLEKLVLAMLAKAPDDRPQTVEHVRTSLEDVVELDLGAARPRSSRADLPSIGGTRASAPQLPQVGAATPQSAQPAAPALPSMFSAPPTPAPASPPVRAGPSKGLLATAGLVMVALGAAATWAVITSRPPPAPQVPVAAVTPPEPVAVADAGGPAPSPEVDAGLASAAPPDEGDAGLTDGGESRWLDAGVLEVDGPERPVGKGKRPPPPPTVKQLQERIAKLTARAKKKPDLDPTALQFLSRYRLEASAADTPARRAKLDKALSDWERSFLKR